MGRAGQLFVGPPQLLDDFFGCVSLSFYENVAALARRQTLILPGSIHGEHAKEVAGPPIVPQSQVTYRSAALSALTCNTLFDFSCGDARCSRQINYTAVTFKKVESSLPVISYNENVNLMLYYILQFLIPAILTNN
jgi:hypothetical protein